MISKTFTCSTCDHWKNKQAELEYSDDYGICTCYKWKFGTSNYSDCMVLDRENFSGKGMNVNHFENQSKDIPIGRVEHSQYCLVTEEKFGCIHHSRK